MHPAQLVKRQNCYFFQWALALVVWLAQRPLYGLAFPVTISRTSGLAR
jgi:hypothetical protein